MAETSLTIPGAAVRGVASGVLFMAFFGTLWASIGNRFDLFFPIMALIVGVHFFPLAALFQEKITCPISIDRD
jgi:hypothetical protein